MQLSVIFLGTRNTFFLYDCECCNSTFQWSDSRSFCRRLSDTTIVGFMPCSRTPRGLNCRECHLWRIFPISKLFFLVYYPLVVSDKLAFVKQYSIMKSRIILIASESRLAKSCNQAWFILLFLNKVTPRLNGLQPKALCRTLTKPIIGRSAPFVRNWLPKIFIFLRAPLNDICW